VSGAKYQPEDKRKKDGKCPLSLLFWVKLESHAPVISIDRKK
jgi:hypothetical protein